MILKKQTGPVLLIAAGAVLSLLAAGSPAAAQVAEPWVLFGHDNTSATTVIISTVNGLARPVGPLGFVSTSSGLAEARAPVPTTGGVVYPVGSIFGLLRDATFDKDYLVAIKNETGIGTKVVELDFAVGGRGIAFGADGKTLYAMVSSGELYTIGTTDGAITLVGEVTDSEGNRYSGVSLEWDPIAGSFLAFAGSGSRTLIRIDPSDAHATVIGTLGNFGACTLARAPGPVEGPAGRVFATGTLLTINSSTNDLHAVILNAAGNAIQENLIIGGLGPNATNVCGTAFALPELPTPTATLPAYPPPYPPPVTPTPSATASMTPTASATPKPGTTPTVTKTPTATKTPAVPTCICRVVQQRVPAVVIFDALANPDRYYGWQYPLDQGKPRGPNNPPRECLSLMNVGIPYHPMWNKPIWRVGCP